MLKHSCCLVRRAGSAIALATAVGLAVPALHAQRQMERLGRGLVALRTGTTTAYLSWRLLGTEPEDTGFNVYRVIGTATNKLNSTPLTNITCYTDSAANFSYSITYIVRPVIGGIETGPVGTYTLPAGAPTRQYIPVPLSTVTNGAYPPYDVKFCWVGDFDGDGEYDFVVDRLSTTAGVNQYLQGYSRDGRCLWQVNMGFNSTNQYNIEPGASAISIGHGDKVTVFDMDGDGRAEVLLITANGVVLGDGATVTAPNNTVQYLSVLDGQTGREQARAQVPNPWLSEGPLNGHMGIMFCDGTRPTVVFSGENRNTDGSFNLIITAWDYRNGALTQRWSWRRDSQWASVFHQIRVADVDHDGRDELCHGGFVIDDTGTLLFTTELGHGDRFHITDINPGRPGLETFAIQQDNPSLLGMAMYESGTGTMLKKWYQTGVGDVGRGLAIDLDPRYKGVEMFSTMGGIYDCWGNKIWSITLWPPEGLWWDADLLREVIASADGDGYSPVVNKFNYTTGTYDRLYSIYKEGVHQAYGARPAFWGDLLGDWREELVLVANDYSELRIYVTTVPATNRLYTLMHNPAYRCQTTCKGYVQASYPDFYLGQDMAPPPPPPISNARLVWRGNGSSNIWDVGLTPNWRTNWFWSTNQTPAVFNPGDSVLFDLTGSNSLPVTLAGRLEPDSVSVHAPVDYTFAGTGSLSGAMHLTKAGCGRLTINTTNDYTGRTLVAEGALVVNGALTASRVVVRGGAWLDGRLCGTGFIGGGVVLEHGGGVSPGHGTGAVGTLTVSNGLTLAGGAFACFDLSDEPAGTTTPHDRLVVHGDLTITGTNSFVINPISSNLPPGLYTLITFTGTLTGSVSNQLILGLDGVPVTLTNPPGQIALLVRTARPPAAVKWFGGLNANTWDLGLTSNWLNGTLRDQFNPGDTATFDSTGIANSNITLVGTLNPASIVVNATGNYRFGGPGRIIGPAELLKSNTGVLTITNTAHSYTGRTVIAGGTVEIAALDVAGTPSSLGAAGAAASNLVLAGGTLRLIGESAYTDRALTLGTCTNTIDIPTSGVQLTLVGQLVGPGTLVKSGSGTLLLNNSNSYTGGTVLKAGRILLGGATANSYGLGTGTVTLEGGTLSMSDVQASETAAWNLVVPAGASARLDVDGRCTLTGSLTGGGTLTVFTPYVRTDFAGDWSAFSGQINVITDSDGGDFRCRNSKGYPNARIHLAAGTSLQNRLSGTPTIPIGELSGAPGSYINAPGGNSGLPVVWRVGGLNTSATFAGYTYNNVGFVKEGTGTWTWTGTNFHTGSTTINGGALLVNGNAAGATGPVLVNATGKLGGTGTIGGATTVYGRLAPGSNGIGTLTFTNLLVLYSSAITMMEVNAQTRSCDKISALAGVQYDGQLLVTNLGGTFAAGDSFKLFDAPGYSGGFAAYSLPQLPEGLAWLTTRLGIDGTIRVITKPRLGLDATGTSLILRATNGPAGESCRVLMSTNITLPVPAWSCIHTGAFDPNGVFSFTNGIGTNSEAYFMLCIP